MPLSRPRSASPNGTPGEEKPWPTTKLRARRLGAGGLSRDGPGEAGRGAPAPTAGMAPEEVTAIDAARDAQLEQARAREAARKSWRLVRPASSSRAGTGASTGTGLASGSETGRCGSPLFDR